MADVEKYIKAIEEAKTKMQEFGIDQISMSIEFADSLIELLKDQRGKRESEGKWERHWIRPGVYEDLFWWCPCCKEPTAYQDAGLFFDFCPKCGAKLDRNTDD